MQRLAVKAATTPITDEGTFEALASVFGTSDRTNDVVMPGAFTQSIRAWRATGKMVPIHWDHRSDAADIIGVADPKRMRETDQGLVVAGKIDLETERGREVWRLVKSNSLGVSFGYLTVRERKGNKGERLLEQLDLFEVSLTPSPMHPDARVLSWKSIDQHAALRQHFHEVMLRAFEAEPDPELAALQARARRLGLREPRP